MVASSWRFSIISWPELIWSDSSYKIHTNVQVTIQYSITKILHQFFVTSIRKCELGTLTMWPYIIGLAITKIWMLFGIDILHYMTTRLSPSFLRSPIIVSEDTRATYYTPPPVLPISIRSFHTALKAGLGTSFHMFHSDTLHSKLAWEPVLHVSH